MDSVLFGTPFSPRWMSGRDAFLGDDAAAASRNAHFVKVL